MNTYAVNITVYSYTAQNSDDQSLISVDLSSDLALTAQWVRVYGWGHIQCFVKPNMEYSINAYRCRNFHQSRSMYISTWESRPLRACCILKLTKLTGATRTYYTSSKMLKKWLDPSTKCCLVLWNQLPRWVIFPNQYKSWANALIYPDRRCILLCNHLHRTAIMPCIASTSL